MTVLVFFALLVGLPAIVALLSETSLVQPTCTQSAFCVGTSIVHRRQEVSTRLRPDAFDVHPATRGEFYYYSVLNYLRVTKVLDDGRIIAVARDNNRLCLSPSDPQLRKASLTERFIHGSRFPAQANT